MCVCVPGRHLIVYMCVFLYVLGVHRFVYVCEHVCVCVCVRSRVGREESLGRGPSSRRKSSLNMAFVG